MAIKDDIQTLDVAAALRVSIQPALRQYVLDQSEPLKERFRVWVRFCDKSWHGTADVDVTSKLSSQQIDVSGLSRVYEWDDFLLDFIDNVDHPDEILEEMIIANDGLIDPQ